MKPKKTIHLGVGASYSPSVGFRDAQVLSPCAGEIKNTGDLWLARSLEDIRQIIERYFGEPHNDLQRARRERIDPCPKCWDLKAHERLLAIEALS